MPADIIAVKGSATANTYVTVEEADDYLDSAFGAEEWIDIPEVTRERLVLSATRMIEELNCLFAKADSSQALKLPCSPYGTDAYGKSLDDGFARAKLACIAQAFHLYQQNDTLVEARGNKIQGVNSESIGPTSKSMVGFNPYLKWGSGVLKLLAPYFDL